MNFASKKMCIQKGLHVNPLKPSETPQPEVPARFVQNCAELKSIEEIPSNYRHIFNSYRTFNSVQSRVFNDVFCTNKSIIISAPTGSGKTVIFEFAIVQLLIQLRANSSNEDFKIIYVAPIKSLCSEKYYDWTQKFGILGITCKEVTGDSDVLDFNELSSVKLIITTPEKWDSLTRKWKENEEFGVSIKLFLIDEVHLLNEDVRGPILETIVSRMKTIQFYMKMRKRNEMKLRFVAASATIPNIEDLALWLGGKDEVCFHQIAEEERPVKLDKHVLGFSSNCSGFKFDMSLNYKLSGVIRRYSGGKPTLVFCSSRKAVEMASAVLLKESPLIPLSDNQKYALIQLSRKLQDTKLQNLIIKAIAYHHAGLSYDDRTNIEKAFKSSLILVLVSTNTLAVGVNLPAHLVVIKSTEMFVCGSVIEYPESAILQMIGRAGRPQYDTKGVAVIMTQQKNVAKYQNLVSGSTPVESHLHKHLAEHLNSEIVLQTITDLEVAMEWIRSTFLYVRAIKCPKHYGFEAGMTRDRVEKKLEEMCLVQINALETEQLITKDQAFGIAVGATEFGRLMARYYISFDTMKLFRKIRGDESLLDILNTIIHCKEFSEFTIRVNDKKTLNDLNKKPIRFPIKGKVKNCENKASCLIQSVLGNITIPEPSLVQDSLKMCRLGERLSKCLLEYVRLSENNLANNVYKALLNSVLITKCLKAKLWENSEFVCKQLKKIGAVYSSLLVSAGKTTLKSLLDTDPRTLEMILNKPPPFGNEIHDGLAAFPEYTLKFHLKNSNYVEIIVQQLKPTFNYNERKCYIIVGDTNNNLLLFSDKLNYLINLHGKFERTFKITDKNVKSIHANLIHESLVGVDKSASIILKHEDDFDTTKKSKKKVQTKLKVSRSTNKNNKSSTRCNNKSGSSGVADMSSIDSLFEDDDYFQDLETNSVIIIDDDKENNNQTNTPKPSNFENNGNPLKRKLKSRDCASKTSKINKIVKDKKENISKNEPVKNVREFLKNFESNNRKQIENVNTSAGDCTLEYYTDPNCKTKQFVNSNNTMKNTGTDVNIHTQEDFRSEFEAPELQHDSYENWLLEDFENCNGYDLDKENVENEYIGSEELNKKYIGNQESNKYYNFISNQTSTTSDQLLHKNTNFEQNIVDPNLILEFEQNIVDPNLILEFDNDDFTELTSDHQVNKNISSNLGKGSCFSVMNRSYNHSVTESNKNKFKTITEYYKPIDKSMATINYAVLNVNKQCQKDTNKNTNELPKSNRKDHNSTEIQRHNLENDNSVSDYHSQKGEVVTEKQMLNEISTMPIRYGQEKYIQPSISESTKNKTILNLVKSPNDRLTNRKNAITLLMETKNNPKEFPSYQQASETLLENEIVVKSPNDRLTKIQQISSLKQNSVCNNSILNMTSKFTTTKNNAADPYLANRKNAITLLMETKNNPKEFPSYQQASETLLENEIVDPKLSIRSENYYVETCPNFLQESTILDLSKSSVLDYSKQDNSEINLNMESDQSEPLNFSMSKHTNQKEYNFSNNETTETMNYVLDFSTKISENKMPAHQYEKTSIAPTTERIEQIVKNVHYKVQAERFSCTKEADGVTQKSIQKINQTGRSMQQKNNFNDPLLNFNKNLNFQDTCQYINQQALLQNTPFRPATPKQNSLPSQNMGREIKTKILVNEFKNVNNTNINYDISKSLRQSTPIIRNPTSYTQHEKIPAQSFCESTFVEEPSSVTESLKELTPAELENSFYSYDNENEELLLKTEFLSLESSFDDYLSEKHNTNYSNSKLVKVGEKLKPANKKHLNFKFIQSVQPGNIFGPLKTVNPIFKEKIKASRLKIKCEPRVNREQLSKPLCTINVTKGTPPITKNTSVKIWEQPIPKTRNQLENSRYFRNAVQETIVKINTIPEAPDILNIINQLQKPNKILDLNKTIHSLCDNGLSKSFQLNIQDSTYNHILDDENSDKNLSSSAKNFISENEIDNKFTYTKVFESTSKTICNQIVRLPDLQSETRESFNSPTPNSSVKVDANDSKFMSFEPKRNRYRLNILRRHKVLPVDENVRGCSFDVEINRSSFLNSIKQEIGESYLADNCKEEVFVKTENWEDDVFNSTTKWEPDGNECIFEDDGEIDDIQNIINEFDSEDNHIMDDSDSDFIRVFSQNLDKSGSIFS